MGKTRLGREEFLVGKLTAEQLLLGLAGTAVKKIKSGTISVNPASLNAVTKAGTAVTLTGAAVGDVVLVVPPTDLEDDLIPSGAVVTNVDELTVYLYNGSAGAVDGAAKNWTYLWFDLT